MISKYLIFISTLLLQSISLFCQEINNKDMVYFDADSIPVLGISDPKDAASVRYFIQTKVSFNVQFKGGYDSLSAFCDSMYHTRKDYDYEELNARAIYTILFDKDLKIEEIRIIRRIGFDNKKYNYDNLIKKILLSTKGKWIKTKEDNSEWSIYMNFFNVR